MILEHRELLFKDLCARLPYDVKVQYMNNIFVIDYISSYEEVKLDMTDNYTIDISEVKPYLFPLSSMTEEQKNNCPIGETNLNIIKSNIGYGIIEIPWKLLYIFIEWCNENHFDYRGLIPMGLAEDATGKNIY